MPEYRVDLIGDASQFANASQDAAKAAENVDESLSQLERRVAELTEGMIDYDEAVGRFRASSGQFVSESEAQERALQGTIEQLDQVAAGMRGAETATRSFANAQERTAQAGVTMRSSVSASANNLAFEMTQAAQDAQFGLAGVANQIPLMSEQFTQLQSKAGSTSGALTALASTFFGPTGLLAAGTLLIQMGPQIADWLTSSEERFRAVGAESEAAADAVDSFVDSASDMSEIPNQLTEVLTRIREVQSAGMLDLALGASQGEIRRGARLAGAPRRSRRVRGLELLRSNLEGTSVEARTLRNALESVGVPVQEILQAEVERATELIQENRQAFQNWEQALRDFSGTPEAIFEESITQFQRVRDSQQELVDVGFIDQQESLERQASFLESQIEAIQTESPFDVSRQEFQGLLSFYDSVQERLEALEEQGEDTQEALSAPEVEDPFGIMDRREERLEQLRRFGEIMRGRSDLPADLGSIQLPGVQDPGAPGAGGGTFDQLAQVLAQVQTASDVGLGETASDQAESLIDSARKALAAGRITEQQFNALKDAADQFLNSSEEGFDASQLGAAALNQTLALTGRLLAGARNEMEAIQQVASGLLSTIGQTLLSAALKGSISGGFGVLGGVATLGGGLISQLQHGGTVNTPLQIVGEQGPELAALPQGSSVSSTADTRAMFGGLASRLERVEAAVREMKIAVPVRETKNKMVQDDLDQGQRTGKTVVANVDQI